MELSIIRDDLNGIKLEADGEYFIALDRDMALWMAFAIRDVLDEKDGKRDPRLPPPVMPSITVTALDPDRIEIDLAARAGEIAEALRRP
jgi:hypothetical protein